ncbi:MAG: DUF4245 domain-containing protein [Propionibacteriaceae bacterium]|nr:DUF4245 domain-containing protein [Propionibacteriaceae bacterium]
MAGRNPRAGARDMFWSMAVLLIPVLVIIAIYARPGDETPQRIDYLPVLTRAQQESPYPVLAPRNLPETWTPTRARWAKAGEAWLDGKPAAGNSWQLGFIDPEGIYIAVQQRDGAAIAAFVAQLTRDGSPGETVTLGGREWQRYISADGRTRSLVHTGPRMSAIVAGDTGFAQLDSFAEILSG